jgi:hypothetical protein
MKDVEQENKLRASMSMGLFAAKWSDGNKLMEFAGVKSGCSIGLIIARSIELVSIELRKSRTD